MFSAKVVINKNSAKQLTVFNYETTILGVGAVYWDSHAGSPDGLYDNGGIRAYAFSTPAVFGEGEWYSVLSVRFNYYCFQIAIKVEGSATNMKERHHNANTWSSWKDI